MKKNMANKKKLQDIITSESFEELEHYHETKSWDPLTDKERELLAILFVKQSDQLMDRENPSDADLDKAVRSLERAAELTKQHPNVLFKLAVAMSRRHEDVNSLSAACKLFHTLTTTEPDFFEAWYAWANTLVNMGLSYSETAYFQDANHKFIEAHAVCKKEGQELAEFHWHWGQCWHFLGKLSGEAVDFRSALDKYKKAFEEGLRTANFWNDYGNSLVELACLIGRHEMFLEAIDHYDKTVQLSPDFFDAWLNLACTYQKLFSLNCQQEYFTEANLAFEKAVSLRKTEAILWLRWAQLFMIAGKTTHNPEQLRAAVEKFEIANSQEPNHPQILTGWGESLLLWGTEIEDLGLLRQAEEKICRAVELFADNTEVWYLYGSCLNEIGRYFGDEHYYHKAIEKFHYGLSLNRSDALLWYGLALAHFAIGELLDDEVMVEKAVRYCTRVIEFGGQGFPQFWNDWGVALMRLGEMTNNKAHIEAALEKFDHALCQQEEYPQYDGMEPEWLYNYGCALDFLGDFTEDPAYYEKAVMVLSRVVELEPYYQHARFNLALAYSHLGELTADIDSFQKSLEHFEVLLSNDNEDETGWNDWGTTLMNLAQLVFDKAHPEHSQGLYEMAESKLLHAIALGSATAHYNLACLYSLQGNFTGAMHHLERSSAVGALPGVDDMMHDQWLDSLRHTPAFRTFIAQIERMKDGRHDK